MWCIVEFEWHGDRRTKGIEAPTLAQAKTTFEQQFADVLREIKIVTVREADPDYVRNRLEERKRREGSVPKLTEAQVAEIKRAFTEFPQWEDVFLFWAPHVYVPGRPHWRDIFWLHGGFTMICDGDTERRRNNSLQAQLNGIANEGFPARIGRGHSQIEMTR